MYCSLVDFWRLSYYETDHYHSNNSSSSSELDLKDIQTDIRLLLLSENKIKQYQSLCVLSTELESEHG